MPTLASRMPSRPSRACSKSIGSQCVCSYESWMLSSINSTSVRAAAAASCGFSAGGLPSSNPPRATVALAIPCTSHPSAVTAPRDGVQQLLKLALATMKFDKPLLVDAQQAEQDRRIGQQILPSSLAGPAACRRQDRWIGARPTGSRPASPARFSERLLLIGALERLAIQYSADAVEQLADRPLLQDLRGLVLQMPIGQLQCLQDAVSDHAARCVVADGAREQLLQLLVVAVAVVENAAHSLNLSLLVLPGFLVELIDIFPDTYQPPIRTRRDPAPFHLWLAAR